jgi:hypothetical protein
MVCQRPLHPPRTMPSASRRQDMSELWADQPSGFPSGFPDFPSSFPSGFPTSFPTNFPTQITIQQGPPAWIAAPIVIGCVLVVLIAGALIFVRLRRTSISWRGSSHAARSASRSSSPREDVPFMTSHGPTLAPTPSPAAEPFAPILDTHTAPPIRNSSPPHRDTSAVAPRVETVLSLPGVGARVRAKQQRALEDRAEAHRLRAELTRMQHAAPTADAEPVEPPPRYEAGTELGGAQLGHDETTRCP